MNDRIIYHLLYQFLRELWKKFGDTEEFEKATPKLIWEGFLNESLTLEGRYSEIEYLIAGMIRDIQRKDRLNCQFCRIDEGLFVTPPVKAENLCKRHRQEYEEQYIDRTIAQLNPGINTSIVGGHTSIMRENR